MTAENATVNLPNAVGGHRPPLQNTARTQTQEGCLWRLKY